MRIEFDPVKADSNSKKHGVTLEEAAGSLLITEAGGLVGDNKGEQDFLDTGNLVAGNPKVFAQLLQIISPHTR